MKQKMDFLNIPTNIVLYIFPHFDLTCCGCAQTYLISYSCYTQTHSRNIERGLLLLLLLLPSPSIIITQNKIFVRSVEDAIVDFGN